MRGREADVDQTVPRFQATRCPLAFTHAVVQALHFYKRLLYIKNCVYIENKSYRHKNNYIIKCIMYIDLT